MSQELVVTIDGGRHGNRRQLDGGASWVAVFGHGCHVPGRSVGHARSGRTYPILPPPPPECNPSGLILIGPPHLQKFAWMGVVWAIGSGFGCFRLAPAIAIHPTVRERLKQLQREVAASCEGLVSEGRDQGSVVFPDALVRFFLTAPVDVRAERRIRQLEAQGKIADAQAVRQDLEDRDERDQTRDEAPLVRAPGSVDIDTGTMDEVAVVKRMVERGRRPGVGPPAASSSPSESCHKACILCGLCCLKCIRGAVEGWFRLYSLRMWNRALPPEAL